MAIGSKIKALREAQGLTQVDLARKSGISRATIQTYEGYEEEDPSITISVIKKISNALAVDVSYFLSPSQSPSVSKSSPSQQVVNNLQQGDTDDNTIVHIPRFTDKASAGYGITNYHSESSILSFTKRELRMYFAIHSIAHLSIMESIGDSMCPTIAEGSLLLIQEDCTDVLEGCIYVVRLGSDLYVKRVQKRPKIKLISDNSKYDPIELAESDELVIVGRVVGAVAIKRF